ncbi:NACHT domain-containing protein [Streptomyces sp. NPDC093221]|uniref:NACHT domain-containing protein n=1 Tax=Streptomyces sp. NPDC093221 TaxID=3366032 RepID=UPI00380A0B65
MAGDVFGFHVSRICRVRGEGASDDLIPLANAAFRPDFEQLATDSVALCAGALALPRNVTEAGAMVVLGEPGAGKTSLLRNLTTGLPRVTDHWRGESDACLWVSGADLTESSYHDELGRHLEGLPHTGEPSESSGLLTVVLDQMDESAVRLRLPGWLKRALKTREQSRVRFLMACRTADYPQAMTPVLSEVSGACWCVDLAPLSREEAVALADSAGVVGEELVTAAEDAGAAVMASVPLTLELLVRIRKTGGALLGTPVDLFSQGVRHLAEDPDPLRFGAVMTTTASQRLGIAGRIAAWMLLSGRRNVWTGSAFDLTAFDVPGDALVGGKEQGPAGRYEVTALMLRETLATALFTAPDDHRFAFRHSSVAAYLAARYLTERGTAQPQLENLFLVGSPDAETASIPPPLRETAAWLVALNPTATAWLADADPESLAVHSALVRSDEVRHLTVARLLERALEVELGGTYWQLSRWDLRHPLLAVQLADVLDAVSADQAAEWKVRARVRLAVELARDAGDADPRLTGCLLKIAADSHWHQTERRLASSAAFARDAAETAPVLAETLASLNDPAFEASADPDHDLRGTVLGLLWPNRVDVETMLAALRRPSAQHYNAYTEFLGSMAGKSTDTQLTEILTWAKDAVRRPDPKSNEFHFEPHSTELDWVNSLINRTLRSTTPQLHLEMISDIAISLFREHHRLRLPESLQPDDQGVEAPQVQQLRRELAASLVTASVRGSLEPRLASWLIVREWDYERPFSLYEGARVNAPARQQLLDAGDFDWARERAQIAAAAGSDGLVAGFGELAARLFVPSDQVAFDSAYDSDHPVWPYISGSYDPIEIDSQYADSLRRSYQANAEDRWPQADEFAEKQEQLLAQVRTGDNQSLWQFLWNLQAEPHTGRIGRPTSDDVRQWPGAAAFCTQLTDLADLGLRYLTSENDHADSSLFQSTHDKRSWAGYLLLVEAHRAERLDELPAAAWSAWTGAILTEMPTGSSSFTEEPRVELLRRAAAHAPGSLAHRMNQLALLALSQGWAPIALNPIDPRWAPEVAGAMERLALRLCPMLDVVPAPPDEPNVDLVGIDGNDGEDRLRRPETEETYQTVLRTWYSLLAALLSVESPTAHRIIDAALAGPPSTRPAADAAVHASRILLAADAVKYWPRVEAFARDDIDLGRRIAAACKHDRTYHAVQEALSETDLVDLYLWLCSLYLPEDDEPVLSGGWGTPAHDVQHWRDGLLQELSQRGTRDAVHVLRRLADQYPDRLSITSALVAATKQHAASNWHQVQLAHVAQVLEDPARRVIRTTSDLLDAVTEVLDQIGKDLPSHGELLWDRKPGKRAAKKATNSATPAAPPAVPDTWRPKPEAALCAYVAHELDLRLAGHRISVNREVLVRPTDAYGAGERTDILIETHPAPADAYDTVATGPLKLVIEVKGAWNQGLITSQETQLADRYLPEVATDAGIYLVGWYPLELWDDPDDRSRRRQADIRTHDGLLAELQDQAISLTKQRAIRLKTMIITVPRPHK